MLDRGGVKKKNYENSSLNLNEHLKVIWLAEWWMHFWHSALRAQLLLFLWTHQFPSATKRASFAVDTRIEFNFCHESKIWTVKTHFSRMENNNCAQHFRPLAFVSQASERKTAWTALKIIVMLWLSFSLYMKFFPDAQSAHTAVHFFGLRPFNRHNYYFYASLSATITSAMGAWISTHLCNAISLTCWCSLAVARWQRPLHNFIHLLIYFSFAASIARVACGNCSIWFDNSMIHAVMIFMWQRSPRVLTSCNSISIAAGEGGQDAEEEQQRIIIYHSIRLEHRNIGCMCVCVRVCARAIVRQACIGL